MQHCRSNAHLAIAYFYFDFRNQEKQAHEILIKSLIVQLSTQFASLPGALANLYSHSQGGACQPSLDSLIITIRDMMKGFQGVYVILDALDECSDRAELLEFIAGMVGWRLGHVHILVTSRRERDLEAGLEPHVSGQINLQEAPVDADIQVYIHERLQKWKKWPVKVLAEIEATLMEGAHGM